MMRLSENSRAWTLHLRAHTVTRVAAENGLTLESRSPEGSLVVQIGGPFFYETETGCRDPVAALPGKTTIHVRAGKQGALQILFTDGSRLVTVPAPAGEWRVTTSSGIELAGRQGAVAVK